MTPPRPASHAAVLATLRPARGAALAILRAPHGATPAILRPARVEATVRS